VLNNVLNNDRKLEQMISGNGQEAQPVKLPRLLVLAAHTDDETIGASAAIGRSEEAWVVYLTDSAPKKSKLRSRRLRREEYAALREAEAQHALRLAGVPPHRILLLGATDQEAAFTLDALVTHFLLAVARIRPEWIITHAYEGGHPDHDSAAFVAAMALNLLEQQQAGGPILLEMTSYFAEGDRRVSTAFRSEQDQGWPLWLTSEELSRKREMWACYSSQANVLREFPLEPERLRRAPVYNFLQPPHPNKLWYEQMGWPMTGAHWRKLARQAMERFSWPVAS
jgi:N-acetylglucosamine malate deacetylase 2